MERAYLLATLIGLGGGLILLRAGRHLGHALHFRFRKGKPYVPGSIRRAATACVLATLLVLGGAALAGARWLVRDFQPINGAARAGRLRVLAAEPLLMELEADAGGQPDLRATGLRGADWQVRGLILTFPAWTGSLGLGAFHRLMAAGDPEATAMGVPASVAEARGLVARLPPVLGVSAQIRALGGSGPLPAWTGIIVSRDGYRLGGAKGGDSLDPLQ